MIAMSSEQVIDGKMQMDWLFLFQLA